MLLSKGVSIYGHVTVSDGDKVYSTTGLNAAVQGGNHDIVQQLLDKCWIEHRRLLLKENAQFLVTSQHNWWGLVDVLGRDALAMSEEAE